MAFNYTELTEADGMTSSVTQESAVSRGVYKLVGVAEGTPPTISQLSGFATFLIGSVDNLASKVVTLGTDPSAGKVRRSQPKMHPFLPDVSVVGVPSISPEGTQTSGNSLAVVHRTPITDQYPLYTTWNYGVEFARRPYAILSDDEITIGNGTYTKPDGSAVAYHYADEWKRWTRFLTNPMADTASASYGAFKFRTASGSAPNGAQYTGQTHVYLENQNLDVEWFCVPKRYTRSQTIAGTSYKSYLNKFANRVNQHAWNGYAAGSLLYLGYQITSQYMPPVPQTGGLFTGYTASPDECVNLKLRFILTEREGTDVPVAPNMGLGNANNIAAGHNLEPNFADRKFYYTSSEGPAPGTDPTLFKAKFASFPLELLFTDPLLTQPGSIF